MNFEQFRYELDKSYREEALKEAFVAGFKASGEGYNGEYMSPRKDFDTEMDKEFRKWQESRR